jgi:hypothetical protein
MPVLLYYCMPGIPNKKASGVPEALLNIIEEFLIS